MAGAILGAAEGRAFWAVEYNHVDEAYDPACLDLLRDLVGQQRVVPSAGVPVANSRGVKFPLWSSWPAT